MTRLVKSILFVALLSVLSGCASTQYKIASHLGHMVNKASLEYDVRVTVTEPAEIGQRFAEQGRTEAELRAELAKGAARRSVVIGALLTLANIHDRWIEALESGTAPDIVGLIRLYCKARVDLPEAKLPDGGVCDVVE